MTTCANPGCEEPRYELADPACTGSYRNKPREPLVIRYAFCRKHVAEILAGGLHQPGAGRPTQDGR